jgi:hypothetical protein
MTHVTRHTPQEPFLANDVIRMQSCLHKFHDSCLMEHYNTTPRFNILHCPICKRELNEATNEPSIPQPMTEMSQSCRFDVSSSGSDSSESDEESESLPLLVSAPATLPLWPHPATHQPPSALPPTPPPAQLSQPPAAVVQTAPDIVAQHAPAASSLAVPATLVSAPATLPHNVGISPMMVDISRLLQINWAALKYKGVHNK